LWSISPERFREEALASNSLLEFADRLAHLLGKPDHKSIMGGSRYRLIKYRIATEGLEEHFASSPLRRSSTEQPLENLTDRASVRNRVIRDNLIPYECEGCGNPGEWADQPLTLHLDHRDGENDNHKLENLRFLCPNCHSQTATYAGRNTKMQRDKRKLKLVIDNGE
jgi:Zn finger protein HypA/HybF involved in hydrogenase expression